MKVVCISTIVWSDRYDYLVPERVDMSEYITIGKHYDLLPNPASKWVWNIIDDRGRPHDISKECFTELRVVNLEKLIGSNG